MNSDIIYWNPKSCAHEKEEVYGEKWLLFIYHNFWGKLSLWALVKRAWFSKWYGWKMDRRSSKTKVLPFIEKYKLNTNEFLEPPESFKTFNAFFFRKLKPDARPIEPDCNQIIFPADGRHFIIPDLSTVKSIYAKGQSFDLLKLLGNSDLADSFKRGSMVISRLCPVDYHRFHFPTTGQISETQLIKGSLFSVSPIALRKKIAIFWENKRYISILENEKAGKIVQLLIGATCVGKVHVTAPSNALVEKGDEYGYFAFGGSCMITIFQPSSVQFNQTLVEQSANGIETYAKIGESMGSFIY